MEKGFRPKGLSVAALLPAMAAYVVYAPALWCAFVNWDDWQYVTKNYEIRSLDIGFLKWAFVTVVASNWHPLTVISYAVDYRLWGLNPFGYHLVNNAFHGFNTFLAGLIAFELYLIARPGRRNDAVTAGAVTALLFGVHPLHVESVAWVSERKDVLSGFFFLLSLIEYLHYVRPAGRRTLHYSLALMLFALALMSKPMAVTLPAVLLLLDLYPLGRLTKSTAGGIILEKAPFFALSAVASVLTLLAQGSTMVATEVLPVPSRLYVAVTALVEYLYKTVLPVGLAPFNPLPREVDFLSFPFIVSLLALVLITVFCALTYKREKVYLVAWLYFLITLSPVIGILQVGLQASGDRYMYLPSLGPFILAGAGAVSLTALAGRKAVFAALVVVFVALSILTIRQIGYWKDSVALWTREVALYPELPSAYNNLGHGYDLRGELAPAIRNYSRAIELDPRYTDAYANRGNALLREGDLPGAIGDLTTAISINPYHGEAYFTRATAYQRLGATEKALSEITTAIRINPLYVEAYNNRAVFLAGLGKYPDAIADLRRAIEIRPDFAVARRSLAEVYSKAGEKELAGESLRKATELGTKGASGLAIINAIE